jgi:RecJ-like exonuclease
MLKPAFITAIAGTFILLILSNNLEPPLIKVSDINERYLDNYVKIQGKIEEIKQSDSLTIIKLSEDNSSINIIAQNAAFQKKSYVEVIGKVVEWHGTLEIEASRIKAI